MISLKKREQSLHEEAIYPIVAALRAKPYSIIGMDRVSHRIRRVMVFVSHYARVQVLIEAKRRSALKKSCNRLAHGHTDQINEDAKDRAFSDTQNLFGSIGAMYMTHGFDILGFGKSLLEKGNLDDLLSVPDLAAGVLQDLLTAQDTGNDLPPGGDEKLAVLKWLATPAKFLLKIHVRIARRDDGTYEGHILTLEPKW